MNVVKAENLDPPVAQPASATERNDPRARALAVKATAYRIKPSEAGAAVAPAPCVLAEPSIAEPRVQRSGLTVLSALIAVRRA